MVPSGLKTTRSPLQPSQSRKEYTLRNRLGVSVPVEVNRCRYSRVGVLTSSYPHLRQQSRNTPSIRRNLLISSGDRSLVPLHLCSGITTPFTNLSIAGKVYTTLPGCSTFTVAIKTQPTYNLYTGTAQGQLYQNPVYSINGGI